MNLERKSSFKNWFNIKSRGLRAFASEGETLAADQGSKTSPPPYLPTKSFMTWMVPANLRGKITPKTELPDNDTDHVVNGQPGFSNDKNTTSISKTIYLIMEDDRLETIELQACMSDDEVQSAFFSILELSPNSGCLLLLSNSKGHFLPINASIPLNTADSRYYLEAGKKHFLNKTTHYGRHQEFIERKA